MTISYKTQYHAIGIPIPSIFNSSNITAQGTAGSNTNSQYDESNYDLDVTPGSNNVVDSNGRSRGRLMVSGDSGLGSDEYIDATILQSGYADQTATYTITPDSGIQYGYTLPSVVTGVGTVIHTTSSSGYRSPRAMVTKDLNHVCVTEDWINNKVIAYTSTDGTSGWTANDIYTPSVTFSASYPPSPEIIQLDDGRLLCFTIELISSIDTSTYIRIDVSDDDGDTWSQYGRRLIRLPSIASIVYDQLRAVFDPLTRTITLMIRMLSGGTYTALHYSSSDLGSTWTECQYVSSVMSHSIVAANGLVIYSYIPSAGSAYMTTCHKAGGAYSFVQKSSPAYAQTTSYITTLLTPANVLVAFTRDGTDLSLSHQWISHDYGVTWGTVQDSYPASSSAEYPVWDDHVGSNTFASGLQISSAYYVMGSICLVGNTVSSNLDYSIQYMRLGQIENVTRRDPMTRALYLPYDTPSNRGWTTAGTATQVITTSSSATILSAAATGSTFRNYSISADSSTYAYITHAILRCVSGGSTTTDQCVIYCTGKDSGATTNTALKLRFSSTTLQCYDVVAAANVGSAITTGSSPIEVLIALDGDASTASVWWRVYTAGSTGRCTWTNVLDGVSLSTTAYSVAPAVQFGSLAAGTTTTSHWYMLGISDTQYDRFADGFDSSDIVGIPLSTSVDHISPDIAVWGRGYYATGDTYRIDAISRTGIDRALEIITYPSPRMGYVVTAPAPSSSWVVVDTGYGDRRIGDTIGLAVLGAVCNQVSMQTWNGTTWTDQLSLSMQTTIGTGYIRSSNTDVWFRPNSTNNNSKYYRQDELVGCLLSVNDGVDSIIAEIISNTEGQFSTSSGTRQMAILAKAFPMSGSYTSLDLSATTGGTVSIIHRDALIIGTQTASARYYRFFLSAILNKLEIGKLIPLRVSLLARQSGPGDQYSHSSNDEIISMPYGFDRSRRLAPAGRNWRFPFRQLISTQNRHNGGTTVNAVAITGSTPRATSDNNLDQLISVVETAGQSTPIVFVSQLDVTSDLTTAVTLLGKNKWMYGRVEDSITATMGRGYRYGDKSTYDVDFSIKEIV